MPVMDNAVAEDAARIAARRAHVARQLDLMIDTRGPVNEVRRLIADLDAVSADLSRVLRETEATTRR
ncbi:hypothetical protein [Falsiroseomonas sp.]|uniref:hypothetical protein n=1 Tax=Falsiroseomonas sp. TaxID=2870721 RepID=UPI0034A42AE2